MANEKEITNPQSEIRTIEPISHPPTEVSSLDLDAARKALEEDLRKRIAEADQIIGQVLAERGLAIRILPQIIVQPDGTLKVDAGLQYVPAP